MKRICCELQRICCELLFFITVDLKNAHEDNAENASDEQPDKKTNPVHVSSPSFHNKNRDTAETVSLQD